MTDDDSSKAKQNKAQQNKSTSELNGWETRIGDKRLWHDAKDKEKQGKQRATTQNNNKNKNALSKPNTTHTSGPCTAIKLRDDSWANALANIVLLQP